MHLGLTPWRISGGVDAQELTRQASLAEGWGYESFWLPENHFTGDAAIPEPLMLLAAVAAGTRTIRLATTSYLLPVRHPLQAAEQVAVLDRLSGDASFLGSDAAMRQRCFPRSVFHGRRNAKFFAIVSTS